jgi:hypothetical protein
MYRFERSIGEGGSYLLRKVLFFLGEMEACEVVDKKSGKSAGRWAAYDDGKSRQTFSPESDNPDWKKLNRALEDGDTLFASEIVWSILPKSKIKR